MIDSAIEEKSTRPRIKRKKDSWDYLLLLRAFLRITAKCVRYHLHLIIDDIYQAAFHPETAVQVMHTEERHRLANIPDFLDNFIERFPQYRSMLC